MILLIVDICAGTLCQRKKIHVFVHLLDCSRTLCGEGKIIISLSARPMMPFHRELLVSDGFARGRTTEIIRTSSAVSERVDDC